MGQASRYNDVIESMRGGRQSSAVAHPGPCSRSEPLGDQNGGAADSHNGDSESARSDRRQRTSVVGSYVGPLGSGPNTIFERACHLSGRIAPYRV